MSFNKDFPKILEKSYRNCNDVSNKNIPLVMLNSKIIGCKIISLPFIDTVNLENLSKEDISFLKEKKSKVEIRLSEFNPKLKDFEIALKKSGFKKNIVKGHMISILTNEEDFWKRFHKHTRNDIRKAEKSGLIIRKIDSIEELKKFFKIYLLEMKGFGTPNHSLDYFINCFEIMGANFFGLNCYFNKEVIGSIILFVDKDNGYVAFNVSSRKERLVRPNDLLYWESIKECIRRGVRNLDFGQIDFNPIPGSREEKLLKFKKKWLGNEYKRVYFTLNFEYKQGKKEKLKKLRFFWRYLPTPIIKFLGPKICAQLG